MFLNDFTSLILCRYRSPVVRPADIRFRLPRNKQYCTILRIYIGTPTTYFQLGMTRYIMIIRFHRRNNELLYYAVQSQ